MRDGISVTEFPPAKLQRNYETAKETVLFFIVNPEKNSRQSAFLNANKLINGDRFEIVRGKYLDKQIQCPNCHYAISRPEEKKT
ncbi:MAG: hypothetical protein IJ200_12125, partial [Prevotella sp.]|nr:hypothetical protein [Prevotella sp.]